MEMEMEKEYFDRPRLRCERALAEIRARQLEKEKEIEEELETEIADIERCRIATRKMYEHQRRVRFGPPFSEAEIAENKAAARELTLKVQKLLFPKPKEEVTFTGPVVSQIMEGKASSEPISIQILHRTTAGLGVFRVEYGVSLNTWFEDSFGGMGMVTGEGFFATKGAQVGGQLADGGFGNR